MILLRAVPTVITRERFQLDFFVDGPSWEGTFDKLEVWRSRGTDQGPYELLTEDSWEPATLPVGNTDVPSDPPVTGPSLPLSGLTLLLLLDEHINVDIIFTGANPITAANAASQIETQSNGLLTSFVGPEGTVVIQTVEPGIQAILRCVGGDAAPLLGLPTCEPGSLAFGCNARIVLKKGEQNYSFVDPDGSPRYFYKARFYNSFTMTVSSYSLPFQGTEISGLSLANLCRGYVTLVDMTGEPAMNQEVLVYNEFNGTQVENRTVVGGNVRLLSDSKGHAEVLLVRGSKVTVSIGGTPLARDVLVPTDCSIESFNMLSSCAGSNDNFAVQVPNISYAVRRTL